jgi:hypothetical protein
MRTPFASAKRLTNAAACFRHFPRSRATLRALWRILRLRDLLRPYHVIPGRPRGGRLRHGSVLPRWGLIADLCRVLISLFCARVLFGEPFESGANNATEELAPEAGRRISRPLAIGLSHVVAAPPTSGLSACGDDAGTGMVSFKIKGCRPFLPSQTLQQRAFPAAGS